MTVFDFFSQDKDRPLPGGCEICDAYMTVEIPAPGIHLLHVHHDDDCPVLRSKSARSN